MYPKEREQKTMMESGAAIKESTDFRLIIAGAGTGGHLFPGIAVSQMIIRRFPDAQVLFVTTGRTIETTVLAKQTFETASIPAAGIKGKSIIETFKSLFILPRGLLASLQLLRRFRPHVVMGMGGYSSGPVILGARILGIPAVIHEQNRLPGMTNRMLSRFVNRIYVSFEDTLFSGYAHKIRFTGNPVRAEILRCAAESENSGFDAQKPLTVLVLGGSQGAHSINMAIIGALDDLEDPEKFRFIHQTGHSDEERVLAAYASKGVPAVVSAFFDDMSDLYRQADLAVCRAGASTVAELAAACVPAIFIPYPYAADNHQEANARGMEETGAARILLEADMDGTELARLLKVFESDRSLLSSMSSAIDSTMGKQDAAGAIADDILELTGFEYNGNNEASE